jgi:hypothetical protein
VTRFAGPGMGNGRGVSSRTRAWLYLSGFLTWALPMLWVGAGLGHPSNGWFGWGIFVLGLGQVLAAFVRFSPPSDDVVVIASPSREVQVAPEDVRVIDLNAASDRTGGRAKTG